MRLLTKIRNQRAAPGIERQIWRLLPAAFLASVLGPVAVSAAARLLADGTPTEMAKSIATADIFAIAAATTLLTAVFTVGVGCIIVMIMKGPAYVADGYELRDADRPDGGNEASRESTREGANPDDDRTP